MNLLPFFAQQAAVSDFLDQCMFEHEFHFRVQRAGMDQAAAFQLVKTVFDPIAVDRYTLEDIIQKGPAGDRCLLENASGFQAELVQTGSDNAVDRGGDIGFQKGPFQLPLVLTVNQRARVDQGIDHLFQVKRIALGAIANQLNQIQRQQAAVE